MKATIEVDSKHEGELIRLGLGEPEARAMIKVMGALAALPKARKQRVLKFVTDLVTDLDNASEDAKAA
ncbi:MAG: hypothetical protein J2P55_00655 [Rhizobiales bacterium]|nr:hypothetical protein [Hyphomicrobiales bacterium]